MNKSILLCIAFFLTACSTSSDAPGTSESLGQSGPQGAAYLNKENLIFTIRQNGGCMMAGPNCAVYRLHVNDNSFELSRNIEDAEVESSGTLDERLVNAWLSELNNIADMDAYIAGLGAGECRACFDGIDLEIIITDAGRNILSVSSSEKKFDQSKKFFKLSDKLYRAMSQEVQLDMKMRR